MFDLLCNGQPFQGFYIQPHYTLEVKYIASVVQFSRYHFQLLAAASNPTTAGIMGAVWVVGRIVYSLGYYSAPSKRVPGAMVSTLTLAALAIFNIYSSLKLLKVF